MLKINTVTMEEKIENLIFLGVDCSKEERKKLTKELLNLFSVSNCCVNCDEAIINEPYCESCYDLANSRDNT